MKTIELVCVSVISILTIVIYFSFDRRRRSTVSKYLHLIASRRHPRTSTVTSDNTGKRPNFQSNYSDVFPPSRRHMLQTPTESGLDLHLLPASGRSTLGENSFDSGPRGKDVPLTNPCSELTGSETTPTGFTIEEIRQLGSFPDYASLSGVPLPQAYNNFDIDRAVARPYRPFRWPYHQTMSLTKMEPDWWLELERGYRSKIAQRKELYNKHGGLVLQYLPGTEMACKELMEMAIQFLCARYPMYFSLEQRGGTNVLKNAILNIETKLDGSLHPLLVLLDHVPEDFALMFREPETGLYYFRAGVICSAQGWTLGSKIGLRLQEVHGPVPYYKEKMLFSMDRYFAKKPTDKAIQRGSWSFEVDKPLFQPPGDPENREWQDPSLTLSRIHLRVDWQTLRRLPLTGSIVFNFKALFTPLEDFRDEPYVPSIALKVLREGNSKMMEYKYSWHTAHIVEPALELWEEEQKRSGKIEKAWNVSTLDESPFYPTWGEKWKLAQSLPRD